MSKETVSRVAKKDKPDVDLTKPVDKGALKSATAADDCFGKMWNINDPLCQVCSANELCGIIFADVLVEQEQQVAAGKETFLDLSDWPAINDTVFMEFLGGEPKTTQQAFDFIAKKVNSSDEVAVVEWIKRFIKAHDNVTTKGGVFHVK